MTACVTQVVRTVDMTPPAQFQGVQTEKELLDIGIAVGIVARWSSWASPHPRRLETSFDHDRVLAQDAVS